jgi:hypothetical protein
MNCPMRSPFREPFLSDKGDTEVEFGDNLVRSDHIVGRPNWERYHNTQDADAHEVAASAFLPYQPVKGLKQIELHQRFVS